MDSFGQNLRMKVYPIGFLNWKRFAFGLCSAIAIVLAGCKPVTSWDISGVYTRSSNGVVDTIVLATNGTFQQTITYTNGVRWAKSGSWVFDFEVVKFDGFYSAFDVDPFKHTVFIVIPPKPYSNETLWVKRGTLLKDSEQPIWIKQRGQ